MKRYNNSYHDISQLKFILVANKSFTEAIGEENAAPLENRVKLIRFDKGYSTEEKRSIVEEHLSAMVKNRKLDMEDVDREVIEVSIGTNRCFPPVKLARKKYIDPSLYLLQ